MGLSWWVGWLGPEEHFQWDLASIFGTALGTTLLALATGALAFLTARDVSATQALAQLGQADQEAREQPIVVVQGASFSGSRDAGGVDVVLVNVGLGPALRVWVQCRYGGVGDPQIDPFLIPTLRPGGEHSFRVPVRFSPTAENGRVQAELFAVSGTFQDRHYRDFALLSQWTAGPHHGATSPPVSPLEALDRSQDAGGDAGTEGG